MRRCVRAALRLVAWTALIALGLGLALVVALGTAPGRRALLRVALPLVNAKIAGHLAVRGIEGDLWHRMVLYDVRLDDAEGVEAIYARRVELRLDARALWRRRVHVRDLAVDGARVTLRHLADNRFNLSALARPAPASSQPKPKSKPSSHKRPLAVEIDHFHVQLDGAYHPPRGHESHPLEWPHGTFDIEGAARFRAGGAQVRIERLVSDARDPLHAHVELRGTLGITPGRAPGGRSEIRFGNVVLTATTDGAELARLDSRLHPLGRWQLHVEGGGPLMDLHAHAIVAGPRGSITVDGAMARTFPGVRWSGRVAAAGLDPAADWGQLPPGLVELEVAGHGTGASGEVTLARLDAYGGGVHLRGSGHSDFSGHGQALVRGSIDRLSRLGEVGVRVDGLDELDGRVQLVATLGRDQAGPRLDARAEADGLWLRHGRLKTTARRLVVRALVGPGRPMRVRLSGRDLEIAGRGIAQRVQPFALRVRDLAVALDGQPRRFGVVAAAELADGTQARLAAHTRIDTEAARVRVDRLAVDRGARHFALVEPAQLRLWGSGAAPRLRVDIDGTRLEARLELGHDRMTIDATLGAPDLGRLGRFSGLGDGNQVGGALRVRAHVGLAERLTIEVTADGERLRGPHVTVERVHATLHSVDLTGDARVDAERLEVAGVPLVKLALHAHGTREKLAVDFDAASAAAAGRPPVELQLALDGHWRTTRLRVVAADLWLRTAVLALPKQAWRLHTPAHLVVADGVVTLSGLRARSGVGALAVDGHWSRRGLDVTADLRDGDLEALGRAAGRPGLLPPARFSGRLHLGGTPASPVVDLDLDARAKKTVAWLGLGINALSLRLFADAHHALLHADAQGRGQTRMAIDLHGAPRRSDGRLAAFAATLDRAQISVHGHTWLLRAPCTVDVGARVDVNDCRLGAPDRGEIALSGSVPLAASAPDALDVTLTTRHLDLRDLHALLAPGHKEPPKTDFEIHAHLSGTRRAPIADLQLSGRGSQIDEGGLPENVNYQISAHYGGRRVRGQASMRQAGTRLGVGATFDLPTTLAGPEQPIALALEARPVPFYKIRQLLPTAIANLGGFFTLRASASGTTRHPRVDAELHMPSWGLDNLRDNNSVVNLAYDGQKLVINSVTSFEAQGLIGALLRLHPPRNSGTMTMELRVPVDVVRLLRAPGDALQALVHDAPIVASAEVRSVDLAKVPMQIVGFDPPFTGGRVDAAVRVGGTLHRPSLHANVRAVGLRRPGVIDHFDVGGAVEWQDARVHLSGKAALRGAPLLTFRGYADLDARRLIDGDGWRKGAVVLDIDVPEYRLARLRDLQPRLHVIDGRVHGRAQLRGTFADPDFRVTAEGRDVALASGRFSRIDATARLHDARWAFGVTGVEPSGGDARVAGELAYDWDAPLTLNIDARALDVRFAGALWSEIGQVGGRLDAHVGVSGTRAAPRPRGWARLEDGQFAFRGDPRRYQAALTLSIDGDEARLTRLALRSDGGAGTLDATGSAKLDGLRPTQMTVSARAHAFSLAYGSAEARFDADFRLTGDRSDGIFHGKLALSRGSIRLPDLGGLGAAEELDALDDVRFDDPRARRNEGRRRAGKGAFIVVHVDGPLALRSREADLDLAGELGVTVAGGALGIEGVLEAQRGSVELLGKRYVVERAQLAFGGAPDDPELHLRLTRPVASATIAIVIEGTAKDPSVRLSCEPPVYDATQLTALILAGRSGRERIAVRELNRQISGLLSAVVIRKIQDELAPGLPIDLSRPLDQQSYAEFSAAPIEVGRFVSDRIYVRYEQAYGGSRLGRSPRNAQEASAEYQLGGGFQLSTTFGDAGVGGVYFLWSTKR